MTNGKRAVVYARISSRKEEKTDTSIETQIEKAKAYISLRDYKYEGAFVDKGISGYSTDRPRYTDMVKFLDEGKADLVVIYRLDRITRNVADLIDMVLEDKGVFQRNNVELASINEMFDTDTSFGRFNLVILGAVNQLHRDLVADSMIEVWARLKSQGRMHTKAPKGYKIKEGALIVDEKEVMNVVQAFEDFAKGNKTLSEVARMLDYTPTGTRNLLQNRTYLGDIKVEGEWINGEHQDIIGEKVFEQVQERLRGK